MMQIPVFSITESDGVFVFVGPNGLSQSMHADDIEAEASELAWNYEMALKIARCHWWQTRKTAEDVAAHDATHSRLILWSPADEVAVAYAEIPQ